MNTKTNGESTNIEDKYNKYCFTDRNLLLLEKISYYIGRTISLDIKNSWLSDDNIFQKEVSQKYGNKSTNNTHQETEFNNYLEIKNFVNDSKSMSSKGIHYNIPCDQEIKIRFKDYDFYFIQQESGDNPIDAGNLKFYRVIYMMTNAPTSIIKDFLNDACDIFEKHYLNMENIDGKININIFDDGFWENLNTRSCRSLDTIYLPDKQVEMIKKDIGNFLNDSTKQRMTNFGIPYKRNFLFEGRCGTGKTSFIMALASEFKHDIAIMSFHDKLNDIQLMRALRSIPDDTFLVLEDIDSLFVERKKNDEFRNRISFSGLLNILDGMAYKEGLITFMTTNHKLHLDPALIRAGRVDKVLSFDYAKKEQFKKMVTKFTDIQDKDKFKQFWDGYRSLGIKITTSLLQQYLIQYLDETDNEERYHKIIKNVELIKEMHDDIVKESKNLYT